MLILNRELQIRNCNIYMPPKVHLYFKGIPGNNCLREQLLNLLSERKPSTQFCTWKGKKISAASGTGTLDILICSPVL